MALHIPFNFFIGYQNSIVYRKCVFVIKLSDQPLLKISFFSGSRNEGHAVFVRFDLLSHSFESLVSACMQNDITIKKPQIDCFNEYLS